MYVILQERFRSRVQEELDARGWSRSELARRMGVAFNSVNQYMRGVRSPGLDVVERFAEALDLEDPNVLLSESTTAKI